MSLPPEFQEIPFAQPVTAAANADRLRTRLPGALLSLLPTFLRQVPDPDGALNRLERFTRQLGSREQEALARQPALLHYLLALFAHSYFLSEMLIQQPELIPWLGREKNLERIKPREELLEEYARFEATALDLDPRLALARFKRRQYLRITLRDILGLATLAETTLELSTMADVLLEKALAYAHQELRQRHGPPQVGDARGRLVPARFAVVSLGKLGGNELNYSSDIDLLFLYDADGETRAPGAGRPLSNREFFQQLAQRLVQLIAGVSREGPVFRVDLRLRPGGREGDLVASLPAAVEYYQGRAQEWELQMLLKARHSAGDAGLVREFLTAVQPLLFRGEMHFAAVESVLKSRERLDEKLDATTGDRLNVKLASGGLRDVEFLAQCLQRLYGRDDPWVRAEGTLVALQKLYDKGYLPARDHFHLAQAYQFLRRVEHRLQLEQGQQTHTLPRDYAALELLARRCGLAATGQGGAAVELQQQLEQHLQRVQAISERVIRRSPPAREGEAFGLRAPDKTLAIGEASYDQLRQHFQTSGSPIGMAVDELEVLPRVQKPLARFLAAALASSATFEEVSRAAPALPRAAELFRLSEPLTELLVRRPTRLTQLLELNEQPAATPLFGFEEADQPWEVLPAPLAAMLELRQSLPQQMAELRRFFWDQAFGWGARQICLRESVEAALQRYTRLVEEIFRAALEVASLQVVGSSAPPLAVLALGRLGTAEMDWGSDADVVFIAESREAQEALRPVAERLIHVLSAYTRDGTLFPVDVRLRPQGGEGELVQTAESVLRYFQQTAKVWEAVTYLKLRPVAGNRALGRRWCDELRAVLGQRFRPWERLRAELREMRQRLEDESGRGLNARDNLKTGAGGLYDIDFIVSAQALCHRLTDLGTRTLEEQVDTVGKVLSADERNLLMRATRLYRAVDHALRLVTGENTARLPRGPRAELVAQLAGSFLGEPMTASLLAARLAETRRNVRAVFQRVFA